MDSKFFSKPINLRRIQITDPFWKKELDLVRNTVIPDQWEALNDRLPDIQPSYCMRNYWLAGKVNEKRQGGKHGSGFQRTAGSGAFREVHT